MAIHITAASGGQQFQINTASASYVMQVRDGFLLHLYYGVRLDDGDHSWMRWEQGRAAFSCRQEHGAGFILDDTPLEYPCFGRGDLRDPALDVVGADGCCIADLRYESHEIISGKPMPEGLPALYDTHNCETLKITLRDSVNGLRVNLYYAVFADENIIARRAELSNDGTETVFLHAAMSMCLELDSQEYDVISNHGTHCRERHLERFPLANGKFELSSRRGASSHVHNPFLILAKHGTTEDSGDAYGCFLIYSGSFSASVSGTQYQAARMLLGLNPAGFSWKLTPGETFTTPEAVLSFTCGGLNALSQSFHRIINNNLIRGKYQNKRRPVLLNSWEACYFGFDEERLLKIGACAADLGIELMVIDDGWFGKRNSDNCSLGDWVVDRRKLPHGLNAIASFLKERNCGLGIWFEPEMVSPDSDLYRAHPDWCLHIENRPRSEGRWQLMLDLSRPEVCDYLYDAIAAVLKDGSISYVKWDFNRNMAEVGNASFPADRQAEIPHRYYLGLYSLLERLTTDFPDVLFESCSGGGGRFDAGMLYYMPQTWTSDDSDAIERLEIQRGTSMIYPLSAMSAHVSASPNHQTSHITPFDTRFCVAFTGSFGYELDPTALSKEDQENVRRTTALYKKYGQIAVDGTYYRLRNSADGDAAAWCIVSPDASSCIASFVLTHVRLYPANDRLPLRGLDAQARYRDVLSGAEFTGSELMGFGLPIHLTQEYSASQWILEKIG